MKKLLLVLSLSPLAVMGQQFNANPLSLKNKDIALKTKTFSHDGGVMNSPVRVSNQNPHPLQKNSRAYPLNAVKIGTTYYDLATNGGMPRRIQTYVGGKVSVVWTNSSQQNKDFIDRGTGYNHFNGTAWIGQSNREINDPSKFETDRAGWPNLVTIDDNGTQKELIVSHYAAGGTGVSGGTFWMKNSSIGSPDFTTFLTKDKPNGPIWPRIAVTGNKVHWIGVNSDTTFTKDGVKTPVVYYRYDVSTNTFDVENMLLPDYAARAGQGGGDCYSIDAVGNTVAILIGSPVTDLALWKSVDQGQNWTKTIIDSFEFAPFNDDFLFDSAWTSDGSGTVLLDNDGKAHVFYPQMRVANLTAGDGGYNPNRASDGMVYWNENTKTSKVIAGRINYDEDETTDILDGNADDANAGYGGSSLTTMPIASIDADGNIYLVYSSPNEEDINADETANYRDLYVMYSKNGGATWSKIQSITGVAGEEDVFPTMPRMVTDGKLHLSWMKDEVPGIFLVNNVEVVENSMMYAAIPTDDILNNELGLAHVGIQEKSANNIFKIGEVYPNPSNSIVNIPVQMKSAAKVIVKVVDMLGKTLSAQNESTLSAGNANLTLDVSALKPGVYFCQVTAGAYTQTQKIVVQ